MSIKDTDSKIINAIFIGNHNAKIIDTARQILKDAVDSGTMIYFENPDGTIIRLEKGFKLHDTELFDI